MNDYNYLTLLPMGRTHVFLQYIVLSSQHLRLGFASQEVTDVSVKAVRRVVVIEHTLSLTGIFAWSLNTLSQASRMSPRGHLESPAGTGRIL